MKTAGMLTRPRATLREAAGEPRLRQGVVVVVVSGLACMALNLLAVALTGAGGGGLALSLATPLLVVVFWLGSGLLVGAGARLMGWPSRRRDLLAVIALTYPVLVAYTAIGPLQALAPHFGGATAAAALGLLALPVIGWFVVLNAIAVAALYDASPLAAAAIALLPYAALSAVLLLLVVVLSLLHAAGAV